VAKYFDFEAEWGFPDTSPLMDTKYRPQQVGGWLARGRKWTMPLCLDVLGTREGDDWVGRWWRWWRNLQPEERLVVEGELSHPEDTDWSKLSGMYGKNGLLHVMATLCWWGVVVDRQKSRGGMEPGAEEDWAKAVGDMTWVLDQLLGSGEIAR
ncbi:hypothetical protein B0H14DRAFT_2339592, partial [Mycena olivaceomarginata]